MAACNANIAISSGLATGVTKRGQSAPTAHSPIDNVFSMKQVTLSINETPSTTPPASSSTSSQASAFPDVEPQLPQGEP
ncbi:hypothetical protein AFLA70_101g002710 [Aspergillus flavus AF70]|nr:hypothetical protein AFLA70_101g002710 [Aspergillus flavus AF70]